ncbi:T9SS type A sorting domain-containing protein [Labilibacter sediminis]|nr:T9SS type A sorting domain-containing protein [Labilibacter sediminis]
MKSISSIVCFCAVLTFAFIHSTIHSQVKINEFVSSNISQLTDEDGEYPDWVEFYNSSDHSIDLGDYSFTDDLSDTTKWNFPPIDMPPGSFQLVFASGKNRKQTVNSWQTIIDKGDVVRYLIPSGNVDEAWKNTGFDDQSWQEGATGIGYGDDDDVTITNAVISVFVRKEFTIENLNSIEQLVLHMDYDDGFVAYINGIEIARDNLGTPGGVVAYNATADNYDHEARLYQGMEPNEFEVHDWSNILKQGVNVLSIQVHNHSISSSDLSCIPFLSVGLNTIGEYPVSDFVGLPTSYLHANFKINAGGEALYLFNNKVLVDSVGATKLPSDISFGRQPDGGNNWLYFENPTPFATNSMQGVSTVSSDSVAFSYTGGKYSNSLSLELYIKGNVIGDIYYTLDGSVPDEESLLYNLPIPISTDAVVRAKAMVSGKLSGPVITNTYILQLTHSLPVVCLSTDPDNLFDYHTGIYEMGPNAENNIPHFGANFWEDWEKPVHFEYYDKQGVKQIDHGAGVKIFGAWSRANPQKSLALFARKEYGDGSFNYKFFDQKVNDKFESIVLRNAGTDFYYTFFRDAFMTRIMKPIGLEYQGFQPAVVYINGQYWGMLNMREKINEHFISDNTQVKPDSVNILENNASLVFGEGSRYEQLLQFIDGNSLVSGENYDKVCEIIDIDNFIDYFLAQTYIDNRDWPGNNIKYWNTTSSRSKYRWILYDTDFGYGLFGNHNYSHNSILDALATNGPVWPNPPWSTLLFRKLKDNQKFKEEFARRGKDYLNTIWKSEVINVQIDSLKNLYKGEMVAHCIRWDLDYNNWSNEVSRLKTFSNYRSSFYSDHLSAMMGFYGSYNVSVDLSSEEEGKVRLNSISPNEYPFTGNYFKNNNIEIKAVPNPGYKFLKWQGDMPSSKAELQYNINTSYYHKAVFEEASEGDTQVIINEIFYKSSDNVKPGDWVELYNAGSTTVNLYEWVFSDSQKDSAFIISSQYLFAPGDYLVICKDVEKFKTMYPLVQNVLGEIDFGLSSMGDNLRLYDNKDNLMDAVDYYPNGTWPEEANGQGSSLELINPIKPNELGANWEPSANGGTPGEQNTSFIDTGIFEIKNNLDAKLKVYPNPVNDYVNISFVIKDVGVYKLELLDLEGKVVKIIKDRFFTEGEQRISWRDFDNSSITNGVYVVRLIGEKGLQSTKMIVN